MRAGVLIPVKAFSAAKRRLSDVLDAGQRAALSRWMAERVAAAADSLPVFVVCDDEEVRTWATSIGATALWTPRLGLNAAVGSGVAQLAEQRFDRVIVAHSDLPLATSLKHFADVEGITLVADAKRDGTNVLTMPTTLAFEFHYGAGSFQAHLHEAHLLGADLRVEHDDALALDVDTPSDLADPRIQEIVPRMGANEPGQPALILQGRVEDISTNLQTPKSALAIGAHPDDVEFGCGATVAKWAADGCVVHHLICTDGSKGTWNADADVPALVLSRQREQRVAAARLGTTGQIVFLGHVDGELDSSLETRSEVARWIRILQPEVVLGHDPWKRYRLHPDHRHAGLLACDGVVAARDPHFFKEHQLAAHRPAALLLWEADVVDHVEEVSGFADLKLNALLAHLSQFESTMKAVDDVQIAAFRQRITERLADTGAPFGWSAAEAFAIVTDL